MQRTNQRGRGSIQSTKTHQDTISFTQDQQSSSAGVHANDQFVSNFYHSAWNIPYTQTFEGGWVSGTSSGYQTSFDSCREQGNIRTYVISDEGDDSYSSTGGYTYALPGGGGSGTTTADGGVANSLDGQTAADDPNYTVTRACCR